MLAIGFIGGSYPFLNQGRGQTVTVRIFPFFFQGKAGGNPMFVQTS